MLTLIEISKNPKIFSRIVLSSLYNCGVLYHGTGF